MLKDPNNNSILTNWMIAPSLKSCTRALWTALLKYINKKDCFSFYKGLFGGILRGAGGALFLVNYDQIKAPIR